LKKYYFIQTEDPGEHKAQIVKFWTEYLKGTRADRFKWLTNGNPFGKTLWILAFSEDTRELIGLVSLMPKRVAFKSRVYHGAIMGDLMIHKDHRVFGPALNLLKAAVKTLDENQFEFIYTMPNPGSLKIIQKVGFKKRIDVEVYIKPINTRYFLKKYLPDRMPGVMESLILFSSSLMKLLLMFLSRQTYVRTKGDFSLSENISANLIDIWEQNTESTSDITTLRSADYLHWRYQLNPTARYKILVYKKNDAEKPSGYAIYCIKSNKLIIYDMLCTDNQSKVQVIKKIEKIAKQERYHAIYFSTSIEANDRDSMLKYGFMPSKGQTSIFWMALPGLSFDGWTFVEGDRNI
jgi:hypothetical protein